MKNISRKGKAAAVLSAVFAAVLVLGGCALTKGLSDDFAAIGNGFKDLGNSFKDSADDIKQARAKSKFPKASQKMLDAIIMDNADEVKRLVAEGENPNAVNKSVDKPILGWAAANGKFSALKALVECGADVKQRNFLYDAVLCQKDVAVQIVKYLIEKGADVNAVETEGGRSVLMNACEYSSIDVVKALVEAGADVNYKGKDNNLSNGASSLNLSINPNKPERTLTLAKYLVSKGVNQASIKDGSLLLYTVGFDSLDGVSKYLISLGADVNADIGGYTPLTKAVRNNKNCLSTMKLLIQSGAKVNQMSSAKDGMSALHWAGNNDSGNEVYIGSARYKKQTEIVKYLISQGADVNLKTVRDGRTPLMCAANYGCPEICEVLINAGAKVNERDSGGKTALSWTYSMIPDYPKKAARAVIVKHGGVK